MNFNWDRAQSTLMAVATVVVAVALVHREFLGDAKSTNRQKSERVADWRTILPDARIIGDPNAPVKVIEFADLQCPFCKEFNSRLKNLEAKYGNNMALAFVHDPLLGHPLAQPAARAAECANSQGRFAPMVDTLYAGQSLYGSRPWAAFAKAAGVRDSAAFAVCMSDTATPPLVRAGIAAAEKLRVKGTPTVLVNDWRFAAPPTDSELEAAIAQALKANARR